MSAVVNVGLGLAINPEDTFMYDQRQETVWDSDFRLLVDAFAGERLRAWVNILQTCRTAPVLSLPDGWSSQLDVERSALLFWQQHDSDNTQVNLVLDAGYGAWGNDTHELTLGRQPVQLSVTLYFNPNDFFAPFAPRSFYRVYKPGVDAVRYERRLDELAQFSLISVLGYAEDTGSDNGWSNTPDWERTSVLGRFVRSAAGFEWGILAGVVRENGIAGVSLQGELFEWLGLRAEGHYRVSRQEHLASGCKLSVGLEHRFASSLTVRFEQLYDSTGQPSIEEANLALRAGTLEPGSLGQHYSAFDMGYEFSPLLTGEFLYLRNGTDRSQSFSLNAVLPLSDESELALQFTLPDGTGPDATFIRSELGLQPARYVLEYRHYF